MPTEVSLKKFAPEKNHHDVIKPMGFLSEQIQATAAEKKLINSTPSFAPAGQSTQMVIGASHENDLDIMRVADSLYKKYSLKRVYYSGYVPISNDNRLPVLGTPVPLIRENRLYQADWLMRFYKFSIQEIIDPLRPHLELDIDPKLAWALRNLHEFPIDINTADYRMILRVPGIGVGSALKIVKARKFRKIGWDELKRFGIAVSRAKYFIVCSRMEQMPRDIDPMALRLKILGQSKYANTITTQHSLFA
jgi:predicted DNA-binding helix-hairpin-helix protein